MSEFRASSDLRGDIINESPILVDGPWPSSFSDRRLHAGGSVLVQGLEDAVVSGGQVPPVGQAGETRAQLILDGLSHRNFNFNSRSRVRGSARLRENVDRCVESGEPITLILPAFCVISSRLRRFELTSVTSSERVSLRFLERVMSHLEETSGHPFQCLVVSDSMFYAPIFGDDPEAALNYLQDLRREASSLAHLEIVDMVDVVNRRRALYEREYSKSLHVFERNPAEGLSDGVFESWLSSATSTVCVDDLHLSFSDFTRLYRDGDWNWSLGREIRRRGMDAFVQYRAMKVAMAVIDWERSVSSMNVRGSIHSKPDATLGVRLYPNYKRSCVTLPYHGVAAFRQRKGKVEMTVEYEVNLAADPSMVALMVGSARVQAYVESGFVD